MVGPHLLLVFCVWCTAFESFVNMGIHIICGIEYIVTSEMSGEKACILTFFSSELLYSITVTTQWLGFYCCYQNLIWDKTTFDSSFAKLKVSPSSSVHITSRSMVGGIDLRRFVSTFKPIYKGARQNIFPALISTTIVHPSRCAYRCYGRYFDSSSSSRFAIGPSWTFFPSLP